MIKSYRIKKDFWLSGQLLKADDHKEPLKLHPNVARSFVRDGVLVEAAEPKVESAGEAELNVPSTAAETPVAGRKAKG